MTIRVGSRVCVVHGEDYLCPVREINFMYLTVVNTEPWLSVLYRVKRVVRCRARCAEPRTRKQNDFRVKRGLKRGLPRPVNAACIISIIIYIGIRWSQKGMEYVSMHYFILSLCVCVCAGGV